MDPLLLQIARQQQLPEHWVEDLQQPVFHWLLQQLSTLPQHPLIVGIHGCQGSGKTTLATALQRWLQARDHACLQFSLDDYYLGRTERQQLAEALHPLLQTRGVPGTHAICRLLNDVQALKAGKTGLHIPRFLKHRDKPAPESQWQAVEQVPDVVIMEGWCLGLPPQTEDELKHPVNALEEEQDPDGSWRQYVNQQLAGPYHRLWKQVDLWLMLRAPGFECVESWRWQQEQALSRQLQAQGQPLERLMNRAQLQAFLQHYQRWTEHGLNTLPQRVHRCLHLDGQRRVLAVRDGSGRVAD